jgi:beta-galactosidase
MSGANWNNNTYFSDVTSYDYGAPLDEAGHPTPKFLAFRKIFAKYACQSNTSVVSTSKVSTTPKNNGSVIPSEARSAQSRDPRISPGAPQNSAEATDGEACLPPIPEPPPVISIPTINLTESTPLWANLPNPIHSDTPKPMEQFDQAYGYILYRHQLPAAVTGNLVLDELHDYAQIYLNGKLAGTLDRRDKQSTLAITTTGPARLDILVENSARINFSPAMRGESKGITKSVILAGQPLTDWQIYPLPMQQLPDENRFRGPHDDINSNPCHGRVSHPTPASDHLTFLSGCVGTGPAFYRAHFTLTTTGDTFLDIRKLGKGALWINGHPIGRFWNIGPQQTLYVPGPWLHKGTNEIVVFDLNPSAAPPTVSGLATPILDGPVIDTSASAKQE